MPAWDPEFAHRLPLYEPLRACAAMLGGAGWPDLAALQRMVDSRNVVTAGGKPLRLIEQAAKPRALEDRYEARTYLRGELQVRPHDWHDLFNLLVWAAFPKAKSALNARHYHALLEQRARGELNRGPAQDALTLFDEGGIVVAASDASLLRDLRGFEWKRLFWHRRDEVRRGMGWYLFGHAIYEKALAPFDGITARGVLLEVDSGFSGLPLPAQIDALDARLAGEIADPGRFRETRELAPVPILGIPGWWPHNEHEAYYDNINYFRRSRAASRI